jgi:hypothetical protein
MSRREFSTAVKVEIIKRATHGGQIRCDVCGVAVKKFQIDHKIAEAYVTDKIRKLTADDGQLLCSGTPDSCHDRKTATDDVPGIARAKRREAAELGVRTSPVKPLQSAAFAVSERTAKRVDRGPKEMPPRRAMFVEE